MSTSASDTRLSGTRRTSRSSTITVGGEALADLAGEVLLVELEGAVAV
jgi:hypothetical protein